MEASATSDEMAEKIRQKVVEGEFSYLPITDDAANKRAEETINRKGWDDALDMNYALFMFDSVLFHGLS